MKIAAMEEEIESNMKHREELEQKIAEREMKISRMQTERDDCQLSFEIETKKHLAEIEELCQKCRALEDEIKSLEQKQANEVSAFL